MSQTERVDSVDEWNVAEDDGVLDASDTLDDDRVGDPLDTGIIAEDHWTAANRFGTTPAEERAGESLEQHLAQEVPDVDPYAEGGDDEDELTAGGTRRRRAPAVSSPTTRASARTTRPSRWRGTPASTLVPPARRKRRSTWSRTRTGPATVRCADAVPAAPNTSGGAGRGGVGQWMTTGVLTCSPCGSSSCAG